MALRQPVLPQQSSSHRDTTQHKGSNCAIPHSNTNSEPVAAPLWPVCRAAAVVASKAQFEQQQQAP